MHDHDDMPLPASPQDHADALTMIHAAIDTLQPSETLVIQRHAPQSGRRHEYTITLHRNPDDQDA
jgi:hypothetical protein